MLRYLVSMTKYCLSNANKQSVNVNNPWKPKCVCITKSYHISEQLDPSWLRKSLSVWLLPSWETFPWRGCPCDSPNLEKVPNAVTHASKVCRGTVYLGIRKKHRLTSKKTFGGKQTSTKTNISQHTWLLRFRNQGVSHGNRLKRLLYL